MSASTGKVVWQSQGLVSRALTAYARKVPEHPLKLRLLKLLLRSTRREQIVFYNSLAQTHFLADTSDFVGWEIFTRGAFEPESLRLCLEIMGRKGGVFADIGAHHGLFSSCVSGLPATRVISVEPNPSSFLKLAANIRRNERTNVSLIHCALGGRSGLLPWRHSGDSEGTTAWSHGAQDGEKADYFLAAVRFADALAAVGAPAPTLVKMDVEGAELSVLEGFDWSAPRPEYFLIEAQPHWSQKFAFLTAHGYRATGASGALLKGANDDPFLEGNALFAKES